MKWSENLENLLLHDQGREKFKRYLAQLDLEEDLDSLMFWEKSQELEDLANSVREVDKR